MEENLVTIGAEIASRYRDQVLKESTKKGYLSRLNAFRDWCSNNAEHCLDEAGQVVYPVDEDVLKSFIALKSFKDPGRTVMQSPGTVKGYISAFKFGFEDKGVEFPQRLNKELRLICKGFARNHAQGKESGVVELQEGKRPLTEEGYRALCKYALTSNSSDSLFVHLYMVLLWNLCQRTVTVANISLSHLSWGSDSLQVYISRHKCDQEGENAFWRNVYANPHEPEICPILSLAVHIFGSSRTFDMGKLFHNSSAEKLFSKWLKKTLSDAIRCGNSTLAERAIGVNPEDLGSHSFRKGVTTSALKHPGGPSVISVFLRCGWKLGDVQSRYIFEGDGADQYLGRAVALLDLADCTKFSVLPDHFHNDDLADVLTKDLWGTLVSNYSTQPASFQRMCSYLLASLARHKDFLERTLNQRHPLLTSRVWTCGILDALAPKVVSASRICHGCHMAASGIPVQWAQIKYISQVGEEIKGLRQETNDKLAEIAEKVDKVPHQVQAYIADNYEGTTPVSASQLEAIMARHISQLRTEIVETQQAQQQLSTATTNVVDRVVYETWSWKGRIGLPIPEGFHMPSCTVLQLWQLWFFGIAAQKIRPFRLISCVIFSYVSSPDKVKFCKASVVIKRLLEYATVDAENLQELESMSLFHDCHKQLYARLCSNFLGVVSANSSTSDEPLVAAANKEARLTSKENSMDCKVLRVAKLNAKTYFNEIGFNFFNATRTTENDCCDTHHSNGRPTHDEMACEDKVGKSIKGKKLKPK